MSEPSHLEKFAEFVIGDDSSELGIARAERDYALHCLEREIAICAQTDAAFLAYVQVINGCVQDGKPCREFQKCGCWLEMREHIDGDASTQKEPS